MTGRALLVVLLTLAGLQAAGATRIKDIVAVQGVRANQLVGYGLVVGLNGTGDSPRNSPFTEQSLQSMLDRMGINVRNSKTRTRNIAAVIVTAELPAFAGKGSRIDVTVGSLGDATSLQGGSLVLSPLNAADNLIYAVAQGPVAVTGFATTGKAETVTQGVPTTGRIANGGLVEREAPGRLSEETSVVLELRNPDFSTPVGRLAAGILAPSILARSQKMAWIIRIDCMSKFRATSSTSPAGARMVISCRFFSSGQGMKRSSTVDICVNS
jgi:flagellar P-ring protein precursor FlgI